MKRVLKGVRIAILNYNGKALMEECLPSIVEAAKASRYGACVTVIDNASTDDSVAFLGSHFPEVDIYQAPANKILMSYNDALKVMQEDIMILLNNDIRVDHNFVDPLVEPFELDPRLFAAGSKCLDFDGEGFQGEKSIGGIRAGLFWTNSRYRGYEEDKEKPSWTVQVALGAFDRKKFLELGGYDDLYFPGTWEDTDICLQAYRRGWHCRYEPKSIIYHKGQVSFNREYGKKESSVIAYRNTFLFMWKNFSKGSYLISHLLFLPARLLWMLLTGNVSFIKGFVRALGVRESALAKGRLIRSGQARCDAEILKLFSRRDHAGPSLEASKKIGAFIIAKNEEKNLRACLESLRGFNEIVVVDSGSTDRTMAIAREYTDKVFERKFDDFASQKNFALERTTSEWVLSIDADERVTEELAGELLAKTADSNGFAGFRVPRTTYFLGKRFRFSGTQNDKPLRLFKRHSGKFVQPIHEFFKCEGEVGELKGTLLHYTTPSVKAELDKTEFYTDLEAQFLKDKKASLGGQAAFLKAIATFVYFYIWKLGFLDGGKGFLYAYYSARYVRRKYQKLAELL